MGVSQMTLSTKLNSLMSKKGDIFLGKICFQRFKGQSNSTYLEPGSFHQQYFYGNIGRYIYTIIRPVQNCRIFQFGCASYIHILKVVCIIQSSICHALGLGEHKCSNRCWCVIRCNYELLSIMYLKDYHYLH